MDKFQIDGTDYDLASLDEHAKQIFRELQSVQRRLVETNHMIAILTKAKRAYMSDLKHEILSAKAGIELGGD